MLGIRCVRFDSDHVSVEFMNWNFIRENCRFSNDLNRAQPQWESTFFCMNSATIVDRVNVKRGQNTRRFLITSSDWIQHIRGKVGIVNGCRLIRLHWISFPFGEWFGKYWRLAYNTTSRKRNTNRINRVRSACSRRGPNDAVSQRAPFSCQIYAHNTHAFENRIGSL